MNPSTHRMFGLIATVAVVAAIVWGFMLAGSPGGRRTERLDERRLQDLRRIVIEMQHIVYDRKERVLKLPLFEDLEALAAAARRHRLSIEDPETATPYGYRVLDEHRYEICADFETPRNDDSGIFWNHPAGRHCWTVDVRADPTY